MNTLQLGLIHGNLRCFGANCNMSRITRFLCYFFLLKYSFVLYFTLFPSLVDIDFHIDVDIAVDIGADIALFLYCDRGNII